MSDEYHCREALAMLVDCVQLCKIIRGEAESCTFNSSCSETFTAVVMQHLCAQDPMESMPSRFLLPVVESELTKNQAGGAPPTSNASEDYAKLSARLRQLEEVYDVSVHICTRRRYTRTYHLLDPLPPLLPFLTRSPQLQPPEGHGKEG
jgi:hypothetical protein